MLIYYDWVIMANQTYSVCGLTVEGCTQKGIEAFLLTLGGAVVSLVGSSADSARMADCMRSLLAQLSQDAERMREAKRVYKLIRIGE